MTHSNLKIYGSSSFNNATIIIGRVPGAVGGGGGGGIARAAAAAKVANQVGARQHDEINLDAKKSKRTSSFLHLIDRHRVTSSPTMKRSITLFDKTPFHRRFGNNIRRALSTEYKDQQQQQHRSPYSNLIFERRKRAATADAVIVSDSTCDEQQQYGHDQEEMNTAFLVDLNEGQDVLIRYLAVVHLHQLLNEQYRLNDLVSLILSDTPRQSLWRKLKGRVTVATSKHQQASFNSPACNNKIFGVPLMTLVERTRTTRQEQFEGERIPSMMARYLTPNTCVPEFVQTCIFTLLGMGKILIHTCAKKTSPLMHRADMSVEGVFRKNGNIRDLNITRQAVDRGDPVDFSRYSSPIQLCALLKRYLHDLPEPLLTFKLYDLWITCTRKCSSSTTTISLPPPPPEDPLHVLHLYLDTFSSFTSYVNVHANI